MWVPWLNDFFGDVFSFCFYHSIIWFLSDELWKLKTHFRCFQVMKTELWWHFCKYTHIEGPTIRPFALSNTVVFFFFFFSFSFFFLFFVFHARSHLSLFSSSSSFSSFFFFSFLFTLVSRFGCIFFFPFLFTGFLGLGSLFFLSFFFFFFFPFFSFLFTLGFWVWLPIPHQNQPHHREQPPNPTFCLTHIKSHPPLWGLSKIIIVRRKKKKKTMASKTQAHVKHTHDGNAEMIQQKKIHPLQTKIQNTIEKLTVGPISSDPKAQNKSPLKTPRR